MPDVPTIFTRTPIEAVIQTTGLEAQVALAQTILGTPAFWGGAVVLFMWRAGYQVYTTGTGQQDVLRASWTVGANFSLMLFGWLLLGSQTATPVYTGPLDSRKTTWSELRAVEAEPAYANLEDGAPAVWGFHFVNSIIEELTGQVHGAVKAASNAPEPADQIRGLMAMQATSLGASHGDVASNFNRLLSNCAASNAKVLERGAEAREMFDLQKEGCAERWRSFDSSFQAAKATMIGEMGDKFGKGPNGGLAISELGIQAASDMFFGAGGDPAKAEAWAFNVAMENHISEQAGRTGLDSTRQVGATFSDSTGDTLQEAWQQGAFGSALLAVADMLPGSGDVHGKAKKAEIAGKFNEYADLIPSLRGFLHAMFAVFYPLAAYAVALGWTRPMIAWLSARLVLGLYSPAATLLYAMTANLTAQSRMASDPGMAWVANNEFTVGGVALLNSEITRIQSAYMMCEMAVFSGFLVGSASVLLRFGGAGGSITSSTEGSARSVRVLGDTMARNGGSAVLRTGAAGIGAGAGAARSVVMGGPSATSGPTLQQPGPTGGFPRGSGSRGGSQGRLSARSAAGTRSSGGTSDTTS